LLRGLPGSGKSTLAKQILASQADAGVETVWFEADHFFYDDDDNYNWDQSKLGQAHSWCQAEVCKALSDGAHVIVSNTFTTKKEMRVYFDMIHNHGQNPNVICMQSNFGSVHGVPDEVLDAMKQRFVYDISDMFKSHWGSPAN
jgi:tRNA uridine 5-carbamoylmethylation protein Kti12